MLDGRRSDRRGVYLETGVLPLFAGSILLSDLDCAKADADELATARRSGRGVPTADTVIVATARANGFSVATPAPSKQQV